LQEVVEGRRWLEQQRDLGQAERRAFQVHSLLYLSLIFYDTVLHIYFAIFVLFSLQEEQTLLLDWLEKAKGQLEAEKVGDNKAYLLMKTFELSAV
jgi:hypothetical protein